MKSPFCFLLLLAALGHTALAETTVAAWNFRSAPGSIIDSKAPDQPIPGVLLANAGSGTLYLDGSNGSSKWNGEVGASAQLAAMGGTQLNGETLPAAKGSASLALRQPALAKDNGCDANDKSLVFELPASTGPLDITYAVRRTSNNAFQLLRWQISTDAQHWTPLEDVRYAAGSEEFTLTTLKSITPPSGAAKVFLKATFSGANPNPSSQRNFQIANFRVTSP